MKREKLKKILDKHYSNDGSKSILAGRRRPSYELMLEMNDHNKIPFTAWKDIKSFINQSIVNEKTR